MSAKKTYPGNKAFYILWNPDSEKPSKVQFPSEEQATRVGKEMATRYGDGFVVMKSIRRIEVPPPPKFKVTEYK